MSETYSTVGGKNDDSMVSFDTQHVWLRIFNSRIVAGISDTCIGVHDRRSHFCVWANAGTKIVKTGVMKLLVPCRFRICHLIEFARKNSCHCVHENFDSNASSIFRSIVRELALNSDIGGTKFYTTTHTPTKPNSARVQRNLLMEDFVCTQADIENGQHKKTLYNWPLRKSLNVITIFRYFTACSTCLGCTYEPCQYTHDFV